MPILITHKNSSKCHDALGCRAVADLMAKRLGLGEVELHEVSYENPEAVLSEADFNGKIVWIADVMVPPSVLMEIASRAKSTSMFDHHKTGLDDWDELKAQSGKKTRWRFRPYPNAKVVFDLNKSGTMLLWEGLSKEPVPQMAKWISDADLYRFELADTKEFSARLAIEPRDDAKWGELMTKDESFFEEWLREGGELMRKFDEECAEMAANAVPITMTVDGVSERGMFALSQHSHRNKVCELLYGKFGGFAVAMTGLDAGVMNLSFRSGGENPVNVRKLTEPFGGGGHDKASGARMSIADWTRVVKFQTIEPAIEESLRLAGKRLKA